jgi:hypothetical protein
LQLTSRPQITDPPSPFTTTARVSATIEFDLPALASAIERDIPRRLVTIDEEISCVQTPLQARSYALRRLYLKVVGRLHQARLPNLLGNSSEAGAEAKLNRLAKSATSPRHLAFTCLFLAGFA